MFEAAAAHVARLRCLRDVRRGFRLQAGAVHGAENKKARTGHFRSHLMPTRDILASLTNRPHNCLVVGFAAETEELKESAQRKLREKNCDLIVANDVGRADIGMDSDENELVIFFQKGAPEKISRASKKRTRTRTC